MNAKEFLNKHCMACGGNWTAMLLSGIKSAFPSVWESLDEKKEYTFSEVAHILETKCNVKL